MWLTEVSHATPLEVTHRDDVDTNQITYTNDQKMCTLCHKVLRYSCGIAQHMCLMHAVEWLQEKLRKLCRMIHARGHSAKKVGEQDRVSKPEGEGGGT